MPRFCRAHRHAGSAGRRGLRRTSSLANMQQGWSNTKATCCRGRAERWEGMKVNNKLGQEGPAPGRHAKVRNGAMQPRQGGARAGSWLRDAHSLLHGARNSCVDNDAINNDNSNNNYNLGTKTNSCGPRDALNVFSVTKMPPTAGTEDTAVGSRCRRESRGGGGGGGLRRCSSGVPNDLLASIEEAKEDGRGAGCSREDRQRERGLVSVVNRVLRKGKSAYN